MNATRAAWAAAGLAAMLLLPAGCVKIAPATRVSVDQLVSEYNANAAKVPRLWARARIRVELSREGQLPQAWGSASRVASPNGKLLLSKTGEAAGPQDFVLISGESLAMELFRMGTSSAEGVYYLWYHFGEHGAAWWGRSELAGAPGLDMPLDPGQLLAALGLLALPEDFTALPTVTLRMTHRPKQAVAISETPAYVLTYLDRQPISGRIGFTREVYFNWDDTDVRRPFLVRLYDRSGLHVLTARLGDYRPIASEDAAEPAVMPTDIELVWEETRSRLHLRLSEMTDEDKWDVEACLFRRWLPGAISPENVTQVDQELGEGGSQR